MTDVNDLTQRLMSDGRLEVVADLQVESDGPARLAITTDEQGVISVDANSEAIDLLPSVGLGQTNRWLRTVLAATGQPIRLIIDGRLVAELHASGGDGDKVKLRAKHVAWLTLMKTALRRLRT